MSKSKSTAGTWLLALAACAVLAGATTAWATPVRFDNDTGFVWYSGPGYEEIGLEIISDAASQTGVWGGTGQFRQTCDLPWGEAVYAGPDGLIEVGGDYDLFLVSVDYGTEIPSGAAWSDNGITNYPDYGTWLPLNQETYLAVQFPTSGVAGIPDGLHYGWIGVTMFIGDGGQHCLDAFAWGYETDAGVAIRAGAPEPGTLALLALGALGVAGRRRA